MRQQAAERVQVAMEGAAPIVIDEEIRLPSSTPPLAKSLLSLITIIIFFVVSEVRE